MQINKTTISVEGKYVQVFLNPFQLENRTKESLVGEGNSIIEALHNRDKKYFEEFDRVVRKKTLTIRDKNLIIEDTTKALKSLEKENKSLLSNIVLLTNWNYLLAAYAFVITCFFVIALIVITS